MNRPLRLLLCAYCGEPFHIPTDPRYNATKYCCKACKTEAKKEQDRKARLKYNQRWKDHIIYGNRFLGNSNLREKSNKDFEAEYKSIKNEINRLNLKNKERWNK